MPSSARALLRHGRAPAAVAVLVAVACLALPWATHDTRPLGVAALALPAVLRYLGGRRSLGTAAALAVVVVVPAVVWGAPAEVGWLVLLLVASATVGLLWRADVGRLQDRRLDAERRAAALSVRDDLTGCTNAHGLQMFGEQVMAAVRRRGDSAHAVLVEVAGLAHVRARCGPTAAEEVLAAVADALRSSTRGTDVVARLGEDVFAVVGPGSGTVPAELERRVRVHLLDAPPVHPADWPCRVTAGSAVLEPWDAGPLSDLLRRAEEDLSLRRALRAPSAPEPPLPHRSRQRRP
jgi:diguanylate cyclase (GGDEF)-like protein